MDQHGFAPNQREPACDLGPGGAQFNPEGPKGIQAGLLARPNPELRPLTVQLSIHRLEESRVVLGGLQLIEQKLDCLAIFHRMQQFTQQPDLL